MPEAKAGCQAGQRHTSVGKTNTCPRCGPHPFWRRNPSKAFKAGKRQVHERQHKKKHKNKIRCSLDCACQGRGFRGDTHATVRAGGKPTSKKKPGLHAGSILSEGTLRCETRILEILNKSKKSDTAMCLQLLHIFLYRCDYK